MIKRAAFLVAAFGAATLVPSSTTTHDSGAFAPQEFYKTILEARQASGAQKWRDAKAKYQGLAAVYPSNGEVWAGLANAHYNLGEYKEAIPAYQKALALGHGTIDAWAYNIGCCYSLMGDVDNGLKWVDRALKMRFENRDLVRTDEDLDNLRGDPRYAKLAGIPEKGAKLSREEAWSRDIDFLLSEIERMHYTVSVTGLPPRIKGAAETLRKNLGSLTDDQIKVQIQRLLAMLGDGHSSLAYQGKALPVRFYIFEEGAYIVNAPEAQKSLIGAKVLKIGSKTFEALLNDVKPYISRDNEQGVQWLGPNLLTSKIILEALGATTDSLEVELQVSKEGKTESVKVAYVDQQPGHGPDTTRAPVPAGTNPPISLSQPYSFYWGSPIDGLDAYYVQYNSVQNAEGETLANFGIRVRNELKAKPVKNLILDVRKNNGGNSNLSFELIRTAVWFKASDPANRIFLITGRNTFSAAQNFTNDIVRMTSPVVVGEPSSSKPFFIGESARTSLPYSGLQMTISTRLHTVNARDQRVWIAPDMPVPVRAADYFAGRDAAIDAIEAVIRSA